MEKGQHQLRRQLDLLGHHFRNSLPSERRDPSARRRWNRRPARLSEGLPRTTRRAVSLAQDQGRVGRRAPADHIMILSHVVSDSILCATAVLSLAWYRTHLNGQLRSYLSITVALIGVTAFLGALRFMGFAEFRRTHRHRRAPLARPSASPPLPLPSGPRWSRRCGRGLRPVCWRRRSFVFVGVLAFGMNALSRFRFKGTGILTLVFLAITRRGQHPEASKWLGDRLACYSS